MRRRIDATVLGSIFVLRGWQAHKLALEAGLRPTYSGVHRGWMADTARLATFEAYCAHRHVWLEVEDTEQPPTPPPVADTRLEPELSLFDVGGLS